MIPKLRSKLKVALRSLGVDVRPLSSMSRFPARLDRMLRSQGISLIFDIGANRGQFAQSLFESGYTGKVVSFEPLSEAHRLLEEVASRHARWLVHPRCALGDHDGTTQIHVAGNSVSSSLLEMRSTHVDHAPSSRVTHSEDTELRCFDSVAEDYIEKNDRVLMKVDTQGYEWQVLDGAHRLLPEVSAILIEASLVELYKGQCLLRDLWSRLEGEGFELWTLEPGFLDAETGRTLQCDLLFVRGEQSGFA